jgi:hypothetical protein
MHNCKLTRDGLIELALDDLSPATSARLRAELKDSQPCQEEFATIRSTLRTSRQALQSALPAEDFWPGYHARLEAALATGLARQGETSLPDARFSSGSRAWLARGLLTSSVRVPAPLFAALLLLFGTSVFFALHYYPTRAARAGTPVSRGAGTEKSLTPTSTESTSASTKIVEVPVIKEKVVTRIVYVETSRHPRNAPNYANDGNALPVDGVNSGVARLRPEPRNAVMSLAGFKPTDEVKLTIIKGSEPK